MGRQQVRAGPGWALAMYATGQDLSRSRVTLYMASPAGLSYAVHTWPRGTPWELQAWSPDGSRALFTSPLVTSGRVPVHLMTLVSGATTGFTLPPYSQVLAHAPAGHSVLAADESGIYLYSLTGVKLARLRAVSGQAADLGSGGAVMSRGGREVVVPAR